MKQFKCIDSTRTIIKSKVLENTGKKTRKMCSTSQMFLNSKMCIFFLKNALLLTKSAFILFKKKTVIL